MIDCNAIATSFFGAVAAAQSETHAARALDPLATSLRASLMLPTAEAAPAPVMRLIRLPPATGVEGPTAAADRLRLRLDEIALARRFGDASDVARVVALTVAELRQAAMTARPTG
jgi:hypothetical protein